MCSSIYNKSNCSKAVVEIHNSFWATSLWSICINECARSDGCPPFTIFFVRLVYIWLFVGGVNDYDFLWEVNVHMIIEGRREVMLMNFLGSWCTALHSRNNCSYTFVVIRNHFLSLSTLHRTALYTVQHFAAPKPLLFNVLQRFWFFMDLGNADEEHKRWHRPLSSLALGKGNTLQALKSELLYNTQ